MYNHGRLQRIQSWKAAMVGGHMHGERKSSIRKHWSRLEGNVHPDDLPIFDRHPHSFRINFPPPAFIGNIDTAPIVILMANGGYNEEGTPKEFP